MRTALSAPFDDVIYMTVNFTYGGVYTLCYLVQSTQYVPFNMACDMVVKGPATANMTALNTCTGGNFSATVPGTPPNDPSRGR